MFAWLRPNPNPNPNPKYELRVSSDCIAHDSGKLEQYRSVDRSDTRHENRELHNYDPPLNPSMYRVSLWDSPPNIRIDTSMTQSHGRGI